MSRRGFSWIILTLGLLAGCAKQAPPAATPPAATPALGQAQENKAATPATTPEATPAKSTEPATASTDTKQTQTPPVKPATPTPTPKAPAADGPTQVQLNLNLVTDDIVAAVVAHPKRMLESPMMAALQAEGALQDSELEQMKEEFRGQTGLELGDVEEIAILVPRSVVNVAARGMGLPIPMDPSDPTGGQIAKPEQHYTNNMKMIGLAFHNYHDTFNTFPPSSGEKMGQAGDPDRPGLSWRVHLLPYLDQAPLYNQFKFDEPWDSDHNLALVEQMPDIFAVEGIDEPGKTSIHVFTSAGAPFADLAASGIRQFTDGTSNTLLAVVAAPDTAEIWTKPGGLELDAEAPLKCLGELPGKSFLSLFADGFVRRLPNEIDAALLTNLVQFSDGNVVSLDAAANQMAAAGSVQFLLPGMPPDRMPIVAMQLTTDVAQAALLERLPGAEKASTDGGHDYFAADGLAFAFPSSRHVLFGPAAPLKDMLDRAATESTGPVSSQLRTATRPFDSLVAVDLSSYVEVLQMLTQLNPFAGPFANLRSLTLTGDLSCAAGEPLVALDGTSSSPETAATLALIVNGMLQSQFQPMLKQLAQQGDANDEAQEIRKIMLPSLQKLEMKADGTSLSLRVLAPEGFEKLPKLLAPLIKQQREAVAIVQKRNNMKQIGLAFHNYHDVFRVFPPAGGAKPGQNGDPDKPGLSWRVHLLPFLDQAPLYNQFNFDEPWDSEHNLALVEQMPDIFKVDGVDEPGKTSIHVFTGPGAPFSDNRAPGIREFTDGTSNTLLCLVAGPDTAEIWTKPGGLDFDPDEMFKALGELGETFQALLADGAVRTLSKTLNNDTLRNLIQMADGNPINF